MPDHSPPSAHVCTPAIAASLQQLMAACQAQAEADAARSLPAGVIVLAGAVQTSRVRHQGDTLEIYNLNGDEDRYRRRRECPAGWLEAGVTWHPSYWHAHHTRVDAQGEHWIRAGDPFVINDYGFLVPVEGAA